MIAELAKFSLITSLHLSDRLGVLQVELLILLLFLDDRDAFTRSLGSDIIYLHDA